MFSSPSSTRLKIVGTEGHSPESLRQEVDRGARFVIYSYNVSLLVVSFKRPTDIYFIRPGESRILKALPFTLISLVCGWWGIPWGIIYTFQSLHQNLTGGKDVTESLLATLNPPPVAPGEAAPPAPPPPPPRKPVSPRRVFATIGVVAAVAAIVYPCVCYFYGQNLSVALISGLKAPYSVELNGTAHQLRPGHPEVVTLAEGDFVLRGAPGAKDEQHFTAETSFFSRPFDRHVLVVNPDRTAVVYRETIAYHPTGATADPNEKATFDLHANQLSYFLPEPDYFIEEFPKTISMPSDSSAVSKTRIAALEDLPLEQTTSLLTEKLGYDATRNFLANQARVDPENERLQRLVISVLKPADCRALLESHLADRPLLVEWHRAYQYFMDRSFPAVDLATSYRQQMETDPGDGTLIYLYARLLLNPAEAAPFYARALHVQHPSFYAAYALGFDAFVAGHYAASLDFIERAKRGGVNVEALRLCERDDLLALGRKADALANVRELRRKDPADSELCADELLLTQSQAPDRVGGQRAIAAFVATLRSRFGAGDYSAVEGYLNARLSYGLGEEREAAGFSAKLQGPMNQFESAVARRDHAAAAKALAPVPELPSHYSWLLMLTAHAAGDTAAADGYFKQAVARLAAEDKSSRAAARHIAGGSAADHAALLLTPNYAEELRILFTALGVRFPAQREAYFARARELDHDPSFPHLLLTAVRKDPVSGSKL